MPNSITIKDTKALSRSISEGLSSWLDFEIHCGHQKLFNERFISLPLALILSNNVRGTIESEFPHPVLSQERNVGRPPQIDFVIKDRNKVELLVETKWAGATNLKVTDILWDCIRLELAAKYYSCEALFVLVGNTSKIDELINSRSFHTPNARNRETQLLNLHGRGKTSIKVEAFNYTFKDQLYKQLSEYPNVEYPSTVVCGFGTCISPQKLNTPYVAAVWNIRPEIGPKRKIFKITNK